MSQDIAVLNCALTLEHLGAGFYLGPAALRSGFRAVALLDAIRPSEGHLRNAETIGRTATERERWHPEHDLPAEASKNAYALRNCIARH